ncbi:hypothetical protein HDU93_007405 [Gonapodya sp. JEL0774]|nr:hypothetical protein HDU93_007405 [Gonapodya sp. JEL0774]
MPRSSTSVQPVLFSTALSPASSPTKVSHSSFFYSLFFSRPPPIFCFLFSAPVLHSSLPPFHSPDSCKKPETPSHPSPPPPVPTTPSTSQQPDDEDSALSQDQLRALALNPSLRTLLANSQLRDALKDIDSAPNPEKKLDSARVNVSEVEEFVQLCLKVVGDAKGASAVGSAQ